MAYSFLSGRFGEEPLFEISIDETTVIYHHYRSFLDQSQPILDDITWNDLDMDRIYEKINATVSGAGDLMLYAMLRQPCMKEAELAKRQRIMEWARTQEDERNEVYEILYACGKRNREDMEQPLLADHSSKQRKKRSYLLLACMYTSLLLSFLKPIPLLFLPLLFFIYSTFRYFYLHKKLEYDMDPLVYLLYHIDALHKLAKLDLKELPEIKQKAVELSKKLHKIQKRGSLGYFENIAGMGNCFTQRESILYDSYADMIYEKQELIKEAFAFLGSIDACISAASYQIYNPELTLVSLQKGRMSIDATAMIHPLVKNCIPNDIDIAQNRLLTGSNATGKSTYLKMVMLNAILAQSFGFAFASKYEAGFYHIVSSMSIHDHLEHKESTFVAELKSIQVLLSIAQSKEPCLCAIDEILRGTNTVERIAASCAILREFARYNCICLSATHDIELTELLAGTFYNYHFSERMEGEKMIFDYKIHKGPTRTRNAIALLKIFDFDQTLVTKAEQRLEQFEKNHTWEVIAGF